MSVPVYGLQSLNVAGWVKEFEDMQQMVNEQQEFKNNACNLA